MCVCVCCCCCSVNVGALSSSVDAEWSTSYSRPSSHEGAAQLLRVAAAAAGGRAGDRHRRATSSVHDHCPKHRRLCLITSSSSRRHRLAGPRSHHPQHSSSARPRRAAAQRAQQVSLETVVDEEIHDRIRTAVAATATTRQPLDGVKKYQLTYRGGSVAEWLACWTQAQKGPGSNRSRDAVG